MKKMKLKKSLIGLLLLSAILSSCSLGKPKDFDYGKVENGKYVNSYFDMEMSFPENWVVQSQEIQNELMRQGGEALAGDNKQMKAMMKVAEIRNANLFLASEYELGSLEANPNINLVVENVKLTPTVKTGNDYLTQAVNLLKQSQYPYEIVGNFETKTINNQEFTVMNGVIYDVIHQKMYVILKNDFAMVFTITYFDDEQKTVLESVINSVKFK
jgi:hypothetical protein